MSLWKHFVKSDAVRIAGCWLGAQYIRLVYLTSRWETVNRDYVDQLTREGKPFVLAFWHGRLLLVPYAWPKGKPVKFLISQHRDGELISRTIAHLGLGSIRGSASSKTKERNKGGAAALRAMMKSLKSGECVGITPDGPKGPRMRATAGVVAVARMSGLPVIPLAYSIRRRTVLNSWDRFILAKPFSRGAFVWGDPIEVPRDATPEDLEALRLRVEDALNAVTDEADARVGQSVIAPDPEPAPAEPAAHQGGEVHHA